METKQKKKCRGFFYKNQWYNKTPLGDFNKNLNISENQLNLGSKEKKWVSPQWKFKKKIHSILSLLNKCHGLIILILPA